MSAVRERDATIMERAGKSYKNMTELKTVNRVRMLFTVFSTNDISTADGSRLDIRFLNDKINFTKRNPYIWLCIHRVTSAD